MRHGWHHYADPAKSPAQRFMGEPQRRCEHCGKVQTQHKDYTWGRIIGRRWLPLAGRKQMKKTDDELIHEVDNDPAATPRERELADRLYAQLHPLQQQGQVAQRVWEYT